MNSKLGHPDFLGLTEQVSVGGMGAAFSDEEEGKVLQPEKGGPALSWQSNASRGTQRAGGDVGGDWTWEDYDPGPDGIPGTLDDTQIPINAEEFEEWFQNWYVPYAEEWFGSSTFGLLGGMNTISGLSGRIPSVGSVSDPFNKFWYAWLFGIAEWADIGDWVPGMDGM